jgi:hypothetical protein
MNICDCRKRPVRAGPVSEALPLDPTGCKIPRPYRLAPRARHVCPQPLNSGSATGQKYYHFSIDEMMTSMSNWGSPVVEIHGAISFEL